MDFLFWIKGFALLFFGYLAGLFGAIQILIILFFGIPTSIKLQRDGFLKSSTPIFLDLVSFLFLSAIFFGVTWGVWTFLSSYKTFYFIGVGFILLMGLGKIGRNPQNTMDYMEKYKKYLDSEFVDQFTEFVSEPVKSSTREIAKWIAFVYLKLKQDAPHLTEEEISQEMINLRYSSASDKMKALADSNKPFVESLNMLCITILNMEAEGGRDTEKLAQLQNECLSYLQAYLSDSDVDVI